MKKIVYFIPVIIIAVLFVFVAFIGGLSFDGNAWLYLALPLIAGVILSFNKWWGCFFGIAIGGMIIYSSTLEGIHIIREMPIGIILCVYYAVMGYISFKSKNK